MRIEISRPQSNGSRRVPLLRLIPDHSRLRIEGRNGVGKTMTMRILQLATGDQPYRAERQAVWDSLRENLGPLTIEATQLEGANRVVWELEPAQWPTKPEAPSDDWDGFSIQIDGRTADLSAVRELIAVERLDGSETARDTIVRRIREVATRLERETEPSVRRSESYIEQLETVARHSSVLDGMDLDALRRAVSVASDELATREATVKTWVARLEQLQELSALASLVARVGTSNLQSEREQIDQQLQVAETRFDEVTAELQGLAQAQPDGSDIDRLEVSFRRAATRHRNLEQSASTAAANLGINPEKGDARHLLNEQEGRLRSLRQRLDALGDLPTSLEVGSKIVGTIRAARSLNPNATIAVLGADQELTGEALARGVEEHRHRSRAVATEDVEALQREAAEARGLATAARDLLLDLDRIPSAWQSVQRAEAKLKAAIREVENSDTQEEIAALVEEQAALQRDLAELNRRRGTVVATESQLSRAGSLDEAQQSMTEISTALGVSVGSVDGELEKCHAGLASARSELALARQMHGDVSSQLEDAEAEILAAVNRLRSKKLGWMQEVLGRVGLDSAGEPAELAPRLQRLHRSVLSVDAALDSARQTISGVAAACSALALGIERNSLVAAPNPLSRAVQRYFEQDIAGYFADLRIAEEIFDGATSAEFDLSRLAVITREGDSGKERAHPLEALSSGERAFTYTLQRIQSPVRPARNRVLVLDEFGAYMEVDKLLHLESFLASKIPGETADQLIVILPLRPSSGTAVSVDADEPTVDREGYVAVEFGRYP